MPGAPLSSSKVICFRCRRSGAGPCGPSCPGRDRAGQLPALDRGGERLSERARRVGRVGLAFAGAALAGALAGALLALLGG